MSYNILYASCRIRPRPQVSILFVCLFVTDLINDTPHCAVSSVLYFIGNLGPAPMPPSRDRSPECDSTLRCPSAPERFSTPEPNTSVSPASADRDSSVDPDHVDQLQTPSHNESHFTRAPSTPQRSPTPPEPAQPPRVFPSPLRREIESQPYAAAEKRKLKLMRMPSYEFTRECNMARNREIGANLGLRSSFGRPKERNSKNIKKPLKA